MANDTVLVDADVLRERMAERMEEAGLEAGMAQDTATILAEADLLGHRTHGIALLKMYLDCIRDGTMASSGVPDVLSKRGAAQLWDGKRLPGAWLTLRAIAEAETMARAHGTGTIVIRRSFHIACLAAYLEPVARRGMVLQLQTSAPQSATVAPAGGTSAVLSPSPLAIGYPTDGQPVLIDISTSVTSNSLVRQLAREGRSLPHPWVIREDGKATADPQESEVILPLGGLDAGHKGYAMGLMVEALTSGLAGKGRADETSFLGGNVFVQIIDPEAFGGLEALTGVMGHVSDLCRAARPIDPANPVRLPGEAALARKARQSRDGVTVDAALWAMHSA
jgi:LDH2 family malate/lactate/ureidoglycolate dehydrogenase